MGRSKRYMIFRSFRKTEKRGIPLKVFLISEEKFVPFDFPPDQSRFPYKTKALKVKVIGAGHVSMSTNAHGPRLIFVNNSI